MVKLNTPPEREAKLPAPRAEKAAVRPPRMNSADPMDLDLEDDCADAEDRAPKTVS